jgi:uncharacterized protein
MRRAKKEITDKGQILAILQEAQVGRLGTNGRDGYPMIKPLNFVRVGDLLYFHSAQEGEKIEDLQRDNRVCFEIDVPIRYMKADGDPCRAFFQYRSVIIKGRAILIENREEKRLALSAIMQKYQPAGGYGDFPEEKVARTAVVRIEIEEMTGKEDLTER